MFVPAAIVLIAAASASVAVSAAPSTAERQVLRRYCSNDYAVHCSEYDIGNPKVQVCFKRNRAKLSEPCRDAISGYLNGKR